MKHLNESINESIVNESLLEDAAVSLLMLLKFWLFSSMTEVATAKDVDHISKYNVFSIIDRIAKWVKNNSAVCDELKGVDFNDLEDSLSEDESFKAWLAGDKHSLKDLNAIIHTKMIECSVDARALCKKCKELWNKITKKSRIDANLKAIE